MNKPGRPTPLQTLLSEKAGLDRLKRESARREALLRLVRECLPEALAGQVYTASLRGGLLSLTVASASWASRLRLTAPSLIDTLRTTHALACERIAVRVRPAPDACERR